MNSMEESKRAAVTVVSCSEPNLKRKGFKANEGEQTTPVQIVPAHDLNTSSMPAITGHDSLRLSC